MRSRKLSHTQTSVPCGTLNNARVPLQFLTNVPTKYQLPTPYGCQDITWTRFSISRSKVKGKGQIKVTP